MVDAFPSHTHHTAQTEHTPLLAVGRGSHFVGDEGPQDRDDPDQPLRCEIVDDVLYLLRKGNVSTARSGATLSRTL